MSVFCITKQTMNSLLLLSFWALVQHPFWSDNLDPGSEKLLASGYLTGNQIASMLMDTKNYFYLLFGLDFYHSQVDIKTGAFVNTNSTLYPIAMTFNTSDEEPLYMFGFLTVMNNSGTFGGLATGIKYIPGNYLFNGLFVHKGRLISALSDAVKNNSLYLVYNSGLKDYGYATIKVLDTIAAGSFGPMVKT